jgi:4-hydroxy-tetrahydrodipicolinate reductase
MPLKRSVLLAGAAGKMGREAVKTLTQSAHYDLHSTFTHRSGLTQDAGQFAGMPEPINLPLQRFNPELLASQLAAAKRPIWLDLSICESAFEHASCVLSQGIPVVIGATGFSEAQLKTLDALALTHKTGVLLVPNFSIGALLMIRFAQLAAKHFNWAEIIELHHEQKKDAPSGTARITAELMSQANPDFEVATPDFAARGQIIGGIPVHSVRLPGLLAHQEVILGGTGQTLTLRHDSIDRASFMPGVLLALDRIDECRGLVYGLDRFL